MILKIWDKYLVLIRIKNLNIQVINSYNNCLSYSITVNEDDKFFAYINNVIFSGTWKSDKLNNFFDYNQGTLKFAFKTQPQITSQPKLEFSSKILDGGFIDKWLFMKTTDTNVITNVDYNTKTFSITNIRVSLSKGELNDKVETDKSII